jgi:hypothetical protein
VIFAKNAEAVWLPKRAEFFVVTGDTFGAKWIFQTDVYSGYQRFSSETNIEFGDSQ